jgi:hypothetical protein
MLTQRRVLDIEFRAPGARDELFLRSEAEALPRECCGDAYRLGQTWASSECW